MGRSTQFVYSTGAGEISDEVQAAFVIMEIVRQKGRISFSGKLQVRKRRRDEPKVEIQQRILVFVTRTNWVLFAVASIMGFILMPLDFAGGILLGALLVTANFHLLARTLKKALTPPHLSSHNVVIAKYFLRFIASGFIIFILIAGHFVNPIGLIIGLSVVVFSIMLATLCELTKLIFKEAV